MHRRVFRRICRCPSIDSTYPASAITREFHLSASLSENGDKATASSGEDGNSAPLPSTSSGPGFKSKFGGSWGMKSTTTTTVKPSFGLTAAELASRNAIRSTLEAAQRPAEAQKTEDTSSLPRKPLNQRTFNRKPDWDCPKCHFRCFGSRPVCPKCNTLNPNESLEPKQKEVLFRKIQMDHSTIKTLGKEIEKSWRGGNLQQGDKPVVDKVGSKRGPIERQLSSKKIEVPIREERRANELHSAKDDDKRGEPVQKVENSPENDKPKQNEFDKWSASLEELKKNEELQRMQESQRSDKAKGARKQRSRGGEEDEYDPEERSRRREKRKDKKSTRKEDLVPQRSPLYLPEFISVSNLADVLGVRQAEFINHLEEIGFENVVHSHVLDAETAGLIAEEYNFEPIFETGDQDLTAAPDPEDKSELPQRPPVVTIMGHVDHGKTTLLDWLRKSSVVDSEHGGITQHIGAFSVSMPSGKSITFLDTPGHAAFLDMRRRGADLTDIVILVVAADDSVKPQTVEAIKHAKQANVPIIVAINKIDKDNVNLEKVKQDLARHGVDVEDYGGDVQAIPVSGKTGQGMLDLEEAIVTLSELQDHRASTKGNAEGWVVEATTKKAGRVATVLVKRGTMRPGDILVAGSTWTRIKTLKNEAGVVVEEATPGMPIEIDGWREQPEAGSEVLQASSEQHAKEIVDYRMERSDIKKLGQDTAAINVTRRETLEQRRRSADEESPVTTEAPTGPKPVNFIVKADVSGSVEAVVNSVSAIGNNEVQAHILRSGVGQVSEFDVKHAETSDASIITFNSVVDPMISRMAEAHGVKIMNHNIIYELIDDVKATASEYLPPNVTQRVTGEAEISQQFEITIKGRTKTMIAGCKVRNGVISRAKKVRVLRAKEIVYDGSLSSLRNVKRDVTEMRKDSECGLGFQDWTDFQVGDHVQSYEEIVEKRYLH